MKHLLDFGLVKFSEPSCRRYRQIYDNRIILDRTRVEENRSRRAEAGQILVVVICVYTSMRRITTFRLTTERIYDGGLVIL
jgi:hypothetical protein